MSVLPSPLFSIVLLFIRPQAAQAHYVWVRASEVIWSEDTRIITVLSDAFLLAKRPQRRRAKEKRMLSITCIRIYNAKKKKIVMITRNIDLKVPLPLFHSHSVS